MPVRYDIAAQVPQVSDAGIDPLNMMAQMRQQRMSEAQLARMAQSMDVQDMQARIAAQRELRQAEAAQRQAALYGTQQEEILQKMHNEKVNAYKGIFQNFVNDQKSLDNFVGLIKRDLPQLAPAFEGKKYSDDWKLGIINPEKAAEMKRPRYREIGGEIYEELPGGIRPAALLQPGAQPAPVVAPAAEGMPGARQDMTTELIKQREGFIEKPKYDVNAYRAGFGSDTVTLPDGTVQKVTPGMRVSREDAERDLQRRIQTEFVPRAAAKVGEENWARLPENTRAALTSVAYNYGTIPSRLVPAVQSGNPEEIARAIEGLAGDNKGINASRRMQEANIARGMDMAGPQAAAPINALAGAPTIANAMIAPAPAAVPAQPITVGTRKQIKGQSNIDKTLDKMIGVYEQLNASGDIVSSTTAASDPLGTVSRYFKSTTLGQEAEKALGSKAQDRRNRIKALRGQLLQDIKEATGQSSKELDSNFELKMALERLGDPTMSIESIRDIVGDLSSRYGTGKIATPEAAPTAPPAAAASRPPLSSFYTR